MQTMLQDLRFGLRGMRRSPIVTGLAILSLALGIGANTAIFSVVNALLLRSLPVRDPQALVLFGPGTASGNTGGLASPNMVLFSYPMYRQMQTKNQVFSGVAAMNSFWTSGHGRVGSSSNFESLRVLLVSGTYFDLLGVKPVIGRVFADSDDQTSGAHPLAVISYDWWSSRFARDPSAVGQTIALSGTVYTIIGVTPPSFFGTTVGQEVDFWVPLQMSDELLRGPHKISDKSYQSLDIIGRLKPGVSMAEAQANVDVILKEVLKDQVGPSPAQDELAAIQTAHIQLRSAATGISQLRQEFSDPLKMLMGVVALVLLIACANIANLLLARGTARWREIAVRMALGAGRKRLVRQLLTESLTLAAAGGALGIFFASWANRFLVVMVSAGGPVIPLDVALDGRVLAFTPAVTFGTAVLFGVLPAFRSTRLDLTSSLKDGRGAAASDARSTLGRALIVSQVALSLVLLVGAGLFLRSLINLTKVNTGFNPDGVAVFDVDAPASGYTDDAHLVSLYHIVEDRVNSIPGVRAASFSIFSFSRNSWNNDVYAEGAPKDSAADRNVSYNAVGPGYFAVMGMPILEGREIGPQDGAGAQKVAVINETMARRFFPGASAIGKRFGMGDPKNSNDIEVVGVVRDAKYHALDDDPESYAFYSYAQYSPDWGIGLYLERFSVRYSGDSRAMIPEIQRAMANVHPATPIFTVNTLATQVDDSIAYPRLIAQLSVFFGGLAVFLACIGIYGLTSYAVGRRTNEIGIRMALGAQQRDVVRMVMRETGILIGAGLAIGVPIVLASGRYAASLLFGLKPHDSITLGAAVVLLFLVAALAGYLPARRASTVDPMSALRHE
jgi:predicted permease